MTDATAPWEPPFCPAVDCRFHTCPGPGWRWVRCGFYRRQRPPWSVQRYRCLHCRRSFSEQTFRVTYWLQRPDLLRPIFHRLVGCSGFRQIAREFEVSASTVATHAARLGRHCLLFHHEKRPRGAVAERLVLDGFQSFEWSQYHPTSFHLLAGARSHYCYGFTDSELRRSGRMTAGQRQRRAAIEARRGRPDPRSVEHEVAHLLRLVVPEPQALELDSDEHQDYPRALRRVRHLAIHHRMTSSRQARTANNPLFAINLLDLLIRHSGANHKRETIAFSKRRQSAAERLWVFVVWRNWMKWFSERTHDGTPAMRLGLARRRWKSEDVLSERLFVNRVGLPERWRRYYGREVATRAIRHCRRHQLKYAA